MVGLKSRNTKPAKDIEKLLKQKHYKDFVCTQCKIGSSFGSFWDEEYLKWLKIPGNPVTKRLLMDSKKYKEKYKQMHTYSKQMFYYYVKRLISMGTALMDVWVLRRSWTDNRVICYEIKVNRGDFFNDHKWPLYLDFCNEFYFAVPNGFLSNEEINKLPIQAGLIEVNKKGTGLRIRKKPYLMLEPIPEEVFRYILMWRVKIITNKFERRKR